MYPSFPRSLGRLEGAPKGNQRDWGVPFCDAHRVNWTCAQRNVRQLGLSLGRSVQGNPNPIQNVPIHFLADGKGTLHTAINPNSSHLIWKNDPLQLFASPRLADAFAPLFHIGLRVEIPPAGIKGKAMSGCGVLGGCVLSTVPKYRLRLGTNKKGIAEVLATARETAPCPYRLKTALWFGVPPSEA